MAVKAEIKVQGLQQLQQRLKERKELLEQVLTTKLLQLAEEAIKNAKDNKGYKDRTANLKNSISFALFYNGELVRSYVGQIPKADADPQGQSQVSDNLERFAQEEGVVRPTGYSLIVVAGMNYGVHVEHKGYNVLHLTKYFLRDEMRKILEETLKDIQTG